MQSIIIKHIKHFGEIVSTAFIMAALAFAINVATLPVFAQTSTTDTITTQQGTAADTTQNQDNNSLGWFWLLPIVAIPLLFLLLRRNPDRREDYEADRYRDITYTNNMMAGAKGGEVRRERTSRVEDEELSQDERIINKETADDEVREHYEVDPWDRSQDK